MVIYIYMLWLFIWNHVYIYLYIYVDIATGMSSCSDKSLLQEVLDNIRVKAHNALMKAAEATCFSSA